MQLSASPGSVTEKEKPVEVTCGQGRGGQVGWGGMGLSGSTGGLVGLAGAQVAWVGG